MHPRADTTRRAYNLHLLDFEDCLDTPSEMPTLEPCNTVPERLYGFNGASRRSDPAGGVHFFLDDYRFEWAWSDPMRYIEMLRRFACVFTPDFSCYVDMPLPMQRWNVYRGRAVGRIWQKAGLNVIPTITFGFEDSYEFCFDGLPKHSTLAISTVGLANSTDGIELFLSGVEAAIERLCPNVLLAYGKRLRIDSEGLQVYWYASDMDTKFKKLRKQTKEVSNGTR